MATTKEDELLKQEEQTQQSGYGYTQSDAVTQAQKRLEEYQQNRPAEYTSRWKEQMDGILDNILNRKDFSYDAKADPLYQQYRDQYTRGGQLAMRDTMGQAAQMTGGYGNSYAQQAGQQTYNGYMQGLTDKIPELYNLALQAYNNKQNDLLTRYNVLGTAENQEYGRYQDGMNAYNAELDRLQNQYNTERSYDYGQFRDSVTDAQQRWANAWAMFQHGQDTPEIRAILGLPEAQVSSGGGGGDGGSGGGNYYSSNKYDLLEGAKQFANGTTGVIDTPSVGLAMQYIKDQTGGVKSPDSVIAETAKFSNPERQAQLQMMASSGSYGQQTGNSGNKYVSNYKDYQYRSKKSKT